MDLYAPCGVQLNAMRIKSNVQAKKMRMDAKKRMYA